MNDPFGASPMCTSGQLWNPNLQEGPDMAPGRACVACHAEENALSGELDAPAFAFAGTLYATAHEPDDCRSPAAEGAHVRVADRHGLTRDVAVNEAGNFYSEESLDFLPPFTVEIWQEGRRRRMLTPAPTGDCNACHTHAGLNGAPGRIVLP
jgi:hypothetical protein